MRDRHEAEGRRNSEMSRPWGQDRSAKAPQSASCISSVAGTMIGQVLVETLIAQIGKAIGDARRALTTAGLNSIHQSLVSATPAGPS